MTTYKHEHVVIRGDLTECVDCGRGWDTNDPYPPDCVAGYLASNEAFIAERARAANRQWLALALGVAILVGAALLGDPADGAQGAPSPSPPTMLEPTPTTPPGRATDPEIDALYPTAEDVARCHNKACEDEPDPTGGWVAPAGSWLPGPAARVSPDRGTPLVNSSDVVEQYVEELHHQEATAQLLASPVGGPAAVLAPYHYSHYQGRARKHRRQPCVDPASAERVDCEPAAEVVNVSEPPAAALLALGVVALVVSRRARHG